MQLRLVAAATVLGLVLAIPIPVAAQDFGVMNSAETINRGNFKVMANPMIVFGDGDTEMGVALAGGYGFTESFDVEVKAAFYDGVSFFGADAEYWAVKGRPVDVSVIVGFNMGRRDGFDTTALDFTFLGSGHVSPRLEVFGALDLARNSINDVDFSFTTAHLVPGIEYALKPDIDLVAELGLGLNDDSTNYVSFGIAYYLR